VRVVVIVIQLLPNELKPLFTEQEVPPKELKDGEIDKKFTYGNL